MFSLRRAGLGTKLNLSLVLFLALVGGATTAVLIYGFSRTQEDTAAASQQALEEVGSLALGAVVGGTAEQGGILFDAAGSTGERAALVMQTARDQADGTTVAAVPPLERAPANQVQYNPDPARPADLLLWPEVDPTDPAVVAEVAYSAALDTVFPALLLGLANEAAFQPSAISFIGVNGVARFYPPIGLHEVLPLEVASDFRGIMDGKIEMLGPEANPERRTLWTAPYEDNAGQGLVVTAETPIYEGDTFRGIIQVDLLIESLIDQIDAIRPTPGSFSFYIDAEGNPVRGAGHERIARAAEQDPAVAAILDAMRDGSSIEGVPVRKAALDGDDYFIAFTAMPRLGGAFGVAAPIDEITESAGAITAGVEKQGGRTLRAMLAAMGGLFVFGLVGASYLNRRLILRPVAELVAGTQAIGAGAMETAIPVRSEDELGSLARAFNQMTASLSETEGRYKRIFDSSADGLTISLSDGTVVDANSAACRMLGYEREEFLTLPVGAHIHPRHREQRDRFLAALRAGHPYGMRVIAIRKDGSAFDVDVRAVPLQYQGATRILTVLRDVTVEVRSEQMMEDRVEERTRELRLLLEVSQNVASTLEVHDLAGRILDQLGSAVPFDGGALVLIDGDESVIVESRGAGALPARGDRRFSGLPGGVGARAIEQRTAVVVPDLAPDAAAEWMGRGLHGDGAARSWLSVPLIAQDRVLGVLDLWSTRPHALGTEHVDLAMAVANQAAIAVENARLFREASSLAALEERQRLARELHDSVSQALYGIALGARTARELLDREPLQAVSPVEYVVSLAEAGLAEMRALIFELRPESLATEGLVSALEKQAAATRARYDIVVETALGDEPDIPMAAKETLYRIAQEAIHNTIKHANASRIELSLRATAAGISLEVGDNGDGFDATAEFPGHLGIRSMRERAKAAEGTFRIESSPGAGTNLTIELPAT